MRGVSGWVMSVNLSLSGFTESVLPKAENDKRYVGNAALGYGRKIRTMVSARNFVSKNSLGVAVGGRKTPARKSYPKKNP